MDLIAAIRRRHCVSKESISSIARALNLSRPTVRKHLRTITEPVYQRQHQPLPKLGEFQLLLEQWLAIDTQASQIASNGRFWRRAGASLRDEGS